MKERITNLTGRVTHRLYRLRRRIATAGVAVLTVMLAFHVVFGANGVFVYSQKRSEYNKLQDELHSLRQENERLGQNIKALRSDPKTIEREAREQLRYARPGEVVYALPSDKPAQTNSNTAQKR